MAPRHPLTTLFAALALLPTEVAVRVVGLKPLYRLGGRLFRVQPRARPTAAEAASIAQAIAGVNARLRPRRAACLGRSLVTWAALRSHGYDVDLRIGGRKQGEAFQAHAWVEWRGQALAEPEDIQQTYAAFPLEHAHFGLRAG